MQEGNIVAIRIVLDATLPRGGRTIDLGTTDPMAVIDAFAMGDLSPEEADKIASAYVRVQNVNEIDDLRKRLDELEQALGARK